MNTASDLPKWLKTRVVLNHSTKYLLKKFNVHTVCEETRCPNKSYCFSKPTAAFMILGNICSRNCRFCSVPSGQPQEIDNNESERIANFAKEINLKYIVITAVTRDDLIDGGASQFAKTIKIVRQSLHSVKIEVLTPDFKGDITSLKIVLDANPDVFNHNMETIKRLYPTIRPQADYQRSLRILRTAKGISPSIKVKSGLMLGLGETIDEVIKLFYDLKSTGCNILTIGQYLQPSKNNQPVAKYISPDIFKKLKNIAYNIGFEFVASAPLVRSSMNAEEMLEGM